MTATTEEIVLNKREKQLLKDIDSYRGGYSTHWTPVTRGKLVEKGLAELRGDKVFLSDAGKALARRL